MIYIFDFANRVPLIFIPWRYPSNTSCFLDKVSPRPCVVTKVAFDTRQTFNQIKLEGNDRQTDSVRNTVSMFCFAVILCFGPLSMFHLLRAAKLINNGEVCEKWFETGSFLVHVFPVLSRDPNKLKFILRKSIKNTRDSDRGQI